MFGREYVENILLATSTPLQPLSFPSMCVGQTCSIIDISLIFISMKLFVASVAVQWKVKTFKNVEDKIRKHDIYVFCPLGL